MPPLSLQPKVAVLRQWGRAGDYHWCLGRSLAAALLKHIQNAATICVLVAGKTYL